MCMLGGYNELVPIEEKNTIRGKEQGADCEFLLENSYLWWWEGGGGEYRVRKTAPTRERRLN